MKYRPSYIYQRAENGWHVGYFEPPRYRSFAILMETPSKSEAIAETKRLINARRAHENRTPQEFIAEIRSRL